jgi:hypothetical protein
VLPAGLPYVLNTPPSGSDNLITGDLNIKSDVTIAGGGAASTTIDGNGKDRVFNIAFGAHVTIQDVTITGGLLPPGTNGADDQVNGGAGYPPGSGGGIANSGTLTLNGTIVTGNRGGKGGVGGDATGKSTISDSAGENAAGGAGGEGGLGGGIANNGTLTITDSAITANRAGDGGRGGSATAPNGGEATSGNGYKGGDGVGKGGGRGGDGGGISNFGDLTLVRTTVAGNSAGDAGDSGNAHGGHGTDGAQPGDAGGAGGAASGGDATRGGEGGGIFSELGSVTIDSSAINGNRGGTGGRGGDGSGGDGGLGEAPAHGGNGGGGTGGNAGGGGWYGGVYSETPTTIVNSTIAGNAPGVSPAGGSGTGGSGGNGFPIGNGGDGGGGEGGLVGSAGALGGPGGFTLSFVTVAGNGAGNSGAGGAGTGHTPAGQSVAGAAGFPPVGGASAIAAGGPMTLTATIAGPNATPNCAGMITDGGHDLSAGDATCPGSTGDPKLAPLGSNGGPTQTLALGPGSAAIDAIPPGPDCIGSDQRGVARPRGPACDIGAFEAEPPAAAAPDEIAPVLASASITNSVFAVNPSGPPETAVAARRKRVQRGTAFRYVLSEPARVVFTIERRAAGRKVGPKCRKPARRNRRRKPCSRWIQPLRFAAQSQGGPTLRRFSGRIGRKSLKPGRYRATLVATDAAGNRSKPVRLRFRVLKPR